MNIWLIQIAEPLPISNDVRKMRTSMLADELIRRRHEVTWWTSAFDHFEKSWLFNKEKELEYEDNFRIQLLKGIGYRKNVSIRRIIDHRLIARKFQK